MQDKKLKKVNCFAKNFSALVETSHLSQREIAQAVGVSPAAIVHYKGGRTMPGGEELFEISKVFNCSIDWLLTGKESSIKSSSEDIQVWRKRALEAEKKLSLVQDSLEKVLKKSF